MIGIVCKEILALKDIDAGKISINTDHAGMYPASASLVALNGKTFYEMAKDGSLFKMGKDLDKGCCNGNASTSTNHSTCLLFCSRTSSQVIEDLHPCPSPLPSSR